MRPDVPQAGRGCQSLRRRKRVTHRQYHRTRNLAWKATPVAKTVYVTSAQKSAAKTIMKRDAAKGQSSRTAVTKIANANKRSTTRLAATGRYVARRSVATTREK